MIDYDNVTLVPRFLSRISSRETIDTAVILNEHIKLQVPIIASPMPDVCSGDTAFRLKRSGVMGIIHRFQPIETQVKEFTFAISTPETASFEGRFDYGAVGCAIGVTDDYFERYVALGNAGCSVFCIDIANGFNTKIERVIDSFRSSPNKLFIIAGNVATQEGYEYLANLGVDAVRVGIAGGSVCTTRQETGVYMPTLESVNECSQTFCSRPLIIADGGIRYPADMAKALAVGADMIMGGRIFAGYRESPGRYVKDRTTDKLYKLYRGAASHGVQKETMNGEKPDYNEGAEELVPFIDKSVASVIKRFQNGLRSTMSYMGASNIKEFKQNVRVELL